LTRTLIYAPRALRDLEAIRLWFHQPGTGPQARRRFGNLRAAIDRLAEFPCLYPTGDHPGLREASCEGHRVVYRVDPDTGRNATAGDALILRVFGPGQARDTL
jgi:plasmid stabilization system protein ParE